MPAVANESHLPFPVGQRRLGRGLELYCHRAKQSAGARRQLEQILDALNFLASSPLMGELRPDLRFDVRCFSTGNYVIFYVAGKNGVEVERIVHGSRDVSQLF
jgi:toxin ParE1/3/4